MSFKGKDLGQYFTPRSIVKLGAKLANLQVNVMLENGSGTHTDRVLDGCCGTGGFLIEALAEMWRKADANQSLGKSDKRDIKELIAKKRIYGVDVGREPPLARIARMNMYLHGDGGSSVFQSDILDKECRHVDRDAELMAERNELKDMIAQGNVFDAVLTNPPFAKIYDRSTDYEARILERYEIAYDASGRMRSPRPSLRSSLMFIERYHDLLKPGGRLVTVIDDGILSGRDYSWFRDYIRGHFVVKAVISLPGDAFQRSKARVKTSILVLQKRSIAGSSEPQPSVLMYPCRSVGIDDPSRQRTLRIDRDTRQEALNEISVVGELYRSFLDGRGTAEHIVPPDAIADRMDVKSCLEHAGRTVADWRTKGFEVRRLSELAERVTFDDENPDTIITKDSDDLVTYMRVRYDGFAEAGDEIIASDSTYQRLYRVRAGYLVISGMAAFYGSSAIVPPELDGCVTTFEYLVLRAREGVDVRVLWLLLRSPEVRADMLLLGTGIARTRIKWEGIQNIQVPVPDRETTARIVRSITEAENAERTAQERRIRAKEELEGLYGLDNDRANLILAAFKPPR